MSRKICFIGTEITPSEGSVFVGGHVNTVVTLCKGLSKLGWKIHIVTTPSRFLKETIFEFPWAEFHLIKPTGSYSSLQYGIDFVIKAIKLVENISRHEEFDLIHAHAGYFSIAIIPAIAKKKLSTPAIFSLYCPAKMFPSMLPGDKYGIKFLSESLDKIVAVSNNVKNSLLRCGVNSNKVDLIPICFDEETFNPCIYSNNHKNDTGSLPKTILFIGNADRTKGIDIFVKAAKLVLQKCPDVKFIITLHESYEVIQRVKNSASLLLGSTVEVKGVVRKMAMLMASADIIVVPFRSTEGISDIPLVVLEAMGIGKPVVVTKVGGVIEVIHDGKNGLLVEPDNIEQLANAIINLLSNPELGNEIGKNATLSVRRFQGMEVSNQLSNLYAKIIKQ